MNPNHIDAKLTFSIPYGAPRNGVCCTKEAIENAISNIQTLPIVNDNFGILGLASEPLYGNIEGVEWDDKKQQCRITVGGVLYNATPKIFINEIIDDKITSMDIVGVSINELKENEE